MTIVLRNNKRQLKGSVFYLLVSGDPGLFIFVSQMGWHLPSSIPLQVKVIPSPQKPVRQTACSERKLAEETEANRENVKSKAAQILFFNHTTFMVNSQTMQ